MAPASSSLASCQSCHATPATGNNPRFNLSKGSGVLNPNGCEGCHNRGGIAHPYMWLPGRGTTTTASGTVTNATSHANAGTVNASCGLCHGGTPLAGGGSAPSCFPASSINGTTCHFTKPVDSQGSDIGCGSCHGAIPQVVPNGLPNGTVAPNRAYRHTEHFSTTNNLAGLTCSACHTGSGSGTTVHATTVVFSSMTASVAIDPKFHQVLNGVVVPAIYSPTPANSGKCVNVSCHGGKDVGFPAWKSAIPFDPNLLVRCGFSCHTISTVVPATYTGPYIGPFSGNPISAGGLSQGNLHNIHVSSSVGGVQINCSHCHTLPVPGHFAGIMGGRRPLPPGSAAGTIITGNGITAYSGSGCITTCHTLPPADPRPWF